MRICSVRDLDRIRDPGRIRDHGRTQRTTIEPVMPALIRCVAFIALFAAPFVAALLIG
jgi:hypothetical protein